MISSNNIYNTSGAILLLCVGVHPINRKLINDKS